MRKAVISAIAFAVVAPAAFLSNAPLAHAATALSTCYASTCTGHPAASYTCVNDGEVVEQANIINLEGTVIGYVQLKYSPSCRATWARMIMYDATYGGGAQIDSSDIIHVGDASCAATGAAGTGCNTVMIDDLAPLTSTAYGWVYGNSAHRHEGDANTSPPF